MVSEDAASLANIQVQLERYQPDAHWMLVEEQGNILAASDRLTSYLGYPPDALPGKSIGSVNPHISLLDWKKIWDTIQDEPYEKATELIRNDGLLLPVILSVTQVKTDHHSIALVQVKDLLRMSDLQAIVQEWPTNSEVGLWIWNCTSQQVVFSQLPPSLEESLKIQGSISDRELLRRLFHQLTPSSRANLKRTIREKNAAFQVTLSFRRSSGLGSILLDCHTRLSSLGQFLYVYGSWSIESVATLVIQDSAQLLQEFSLDHTQDMIFWARPDGSFAYVNQSVCDHLGYTKQALMRKNAQEIAPSFDEEARNALWEELRSTQFLEHEIELKTSTGDLFPIYSTLYYVKIGNEEFNCVFSRDQTLSKRRQEQIHFGKETLENLKEFVIWSNETGQLRFLNHAARKLTGLQNRDGLGHTLSAIIPALELADLKALNEEVESYLLDGEGNQVPVELSFNHLEMDGETIFCFIGRNITQRKQQLQELKDARAKVEELSDRLKQENILLREEIDSRYNFNNILTKSDRYHQVLMQAQQVAQTSATVLILGETGTGKELLARAIHSMSDRQEAAMIKVNCAALPENLIESELFGHVKGAFTSAIRDKKGRFEMADGGTLFLDEIGELQLDLQAKLLRVLQEGEFEPVGGENTRKVDVRVIAATNKNLEERVQEGKFRQDLYYRLNVFPIQNLPLRERRGDIPLLVHHFMKKYADNLGKNIEKISKADLTLLQQYDFPGNIRELENMVERAVILTQGDRLNLKSSFQHLKSEATSTRDSSSFLTFEEAQRQHILHALEKTSWRISGPAGAGRLLGLNDRTLASKIRKLKIERPSSTNT